MITGREAYKEGTEMRAFTATHSIEVGHLIPPADFQLVSCMGHHRMIYTLHSDRSRAGESRHFQVRCWRTRNHDAQNIPLTNSRQLSMCRISARGGSLHCTVWNLL